MPRVTLAMAVVVSVAASILPGCAAVESGGTKKPVARTEVSRPAKVAPAATGQSRPPTMRGADGADMVLIPAGQFLMGSLPGEVEACRRERIDPVTCAAWGAWESPRHRVDLDAFYIDRYEVTTALFARFVAAAGYRTTAEREGWAWAWTASGWAKADGATWRAPSGAGNASRATHPVVNVSWDDADAYCRWAGKRLPTEAEWEKAARGTDGRRYPWGPTWDASRANGAESIRATTPVGRYATGASPYGVHDMAGNVSEWAADWFDAQYYARSPQRNPEGPAGERGAARNQLPAANAVAPAPGTVKVLRGGSWSSFPIVLRAASRRSVPPDWRSVFTGFRCATPPTATTVTAAAPGATSTGTSATAAATAGASPSGPGIFALHPPSTSTSSTP